MREEYMCDGGRKDPDVFFSAKNLRNAPWEVVYACYRYTRYPKLAHNLVHHTIATMSTMGF
jgi:hypothetical protein